MLTPGISEFINRPRKAFQMGRLRQTEAEIWLLTASNPLLQRQFQHSSRVQSSDAQYLTHQTEVGRSTRAVAKFAYRADRMFAKPADVDL
jgi:hypothetical protein